MKRIFFIFSLLFLLTSCAATPGPNLASKASMLHKNLSTKGDVLSLLGPPVQAFVTPEGKEEWYYYYRVKNFWENFPLIRDYKGEDYTEVLKIIFQGDILVEAFYYTIENPAKVRK